jgi:glutathione S-transferase
VKHYFHPISRGATTAWMFAELDVEREDIVVDLRGSEQERLAFRAINPMGKIPALVDGDVVVTETAAICAYLAERFPERGLAPEPGSRERGTYYRYLFVPGTTLEPVFSLASLGFEHPAPQSAGWGDVTRALATIEAMVPEKGWALGERFTAADIVFGGTLDFLVILVGLEPSPRVAAYLERLRSRPAYQATHAVFASN